MARSKWATFSTHCTICCRPVSSTALAELQEHVASRPGVEPKVALSGFAFDLRVEHLDGRLVDLQIIAGGEFLPDKPIDGQEQMGHLLDPLHHLLPRNDR